MERVADIPGITNPVEGASLLELKSRISASDKLIKEMEALDAGQLHGSMNANIRAVKKLRNRLTDQLEKETGRVMYRAPSGAKRDVETRFTLILGPEIENVRALRGGTDDSDDTAALIRWVRFVRKKMARAEDWLEEYTNLPIGNFPAKEVAILAFEDNMIRAAELAIAAVRVSRRKRK